MGVAGDIHTCIAIYAYVKETDKNVRIIVSVGWIFFFPPSKE
jgi:hypothetical protein